MMDPVRELKIRAEILQGHLAAGSLDGLARLRRLTEWRDAAEPALAVAAQSAPRKLCLAIVARECGFTSWEHARHVLEGDAREMDFGTLLYDAETGGSLNLWFARYEPARACLDAARFRDSRSFLLAYRRDFFVVERAFVARLGLDPDNADWQAIDWDWARPKDREARRRLYHGVLTALRGPR